MLTAARMALQSGSGPHPLRGLLADGLVGSQAVYVDSTAIGRDVNLTVRDNGQIEFVVKKKDVPLIAMPKKTEEVVSMAVGLESRGIMGAQNTLDNGSVGVAI